jgi:hypothetical protein
MGIHNDYDDWFEYETICDEDGYWLIKLHPYTWQIVDRYLIAV